MKNQGYGIAANCTYVVLSIVVISLLSLMVLYMPNMREIDMNILRSIRHFLAPYPISFALAVTDFGSANLWLWPQITIGSVLISHKKYLSTFLLVFFTKVAFEINCFMKNCICRERPKFYHGYSFPSTHATVTMCLYGIAIYLVLTHVKTPFWRYLLVTVFSLFIFLVALSRMWINVHFLTDVVAGLFLGFLMVNLFIIVTKFFRE